MNCTPSMKKEVDLLITMSFHTLLTFLSYINKVSDTRIALTSFTLPLALSREAINYASKLKLYVIINYFSGMSIRIIMVQINVHAR